MAFSVRWQKRDARLIENLGEIDYERARRFVRLTRRQAMQPNPATGKNDVRFMPSDHPDAIKAARFMPESESNDASDAILRKNDNWTQTAFLAMRTLARKQPISSIGNEQTNLKSLEEMKEWRYDHPDAKAAAKAYPLPLGFLEGGGLDKRIGHSDNLFASLAAFEKRSGRKATSGDSEGYQSAVGPIVAEARRTGRVFPLPGGLRTRWLSHGWPAWGGGGIVGLIGFTGCAYI